METPKTDPTKPAQQEPETTDAFTVAPPKPLATMNAAEVTKFADDIESAAKTRLHSSP